MKYRRFGSLDWQVSALGFGCMRLPVIDEDRTKVNEPEATRMLRHAIDNGVNYVDTAYGYHGGNSERFVGKALQDGYREKVMLATKLPANQVETEQDFDRILNEQLAKCQTDHIDFYLLHSMNSERWRRLSSLGVIEWAGGAKADGRIKHLGFSFHGKYEEFEEVVNGTDQWEFCQIQYNYMNEEVQAGTKGFRLAADKGLAIVIMEPILGGSLATPPEPIRAMWDDADVKRSPAGWALQWLWNKPEVCVVLSGMTAMEHVEDNLASADVSGANILEQRELDLIEQVRDAYVGLRPIPCTQCNYCMPCPSGVNIPRNLELYNRSVMYNQADQSRNTYRKWSEDVRASACTQCRECEEKCPQDIEISEWMTCIDGEFGSSEA